MIIPNWVAERYVPFLAGVLFMALIVSAYLLVEEYQRRRLWRDLNRPISEARLAELMVKYPDVGPITDGQRIMSRFSGDDYGTHTRPAWIERIGNPFGTNDLRREVWIRFERDKDFPGYGTTLALWPLHVRVIK